MKVDRSQPMTLRLRVPLDDGRSELGLMRALDTLVGFTKNLLKLVTADKSDIKSFLLVTFHTPQKKWVSERRFFERCAKFPQLSPKVIAFAENTNPSRWSKDPFHGAGLWTSIMAPAGSLAVVPLALREPIHIAALIEQFRGADLDHETFHRGLVTELVRRYGLREETRALLAFRAVDGTGQCGCDDLRWLAAKTPFGDEIRADGGLEAFALRVHESSRRKNYRPLYVSNAGKALFDASPPRFRTWLSFFESHGLKFDETEKKPDPARAPYAPEPFDAVWEEAASCDDRD
jgi:hypothetical protein